MMTKDEKESLLWKIDNEGFEYAIEEYGASIQCPVFSALRKEFLSIRDTIMSDIEINSDI